MFSISWDIPGHQTDRIARSRHLCIPWCPVCIFSSVRLWSVFGTTICVCLGEVVCCCPLWVFLWLSSRVADVCQPYLLLAIQFGNIQLQLIWHCPMRELLDISGESLYWLVGVQQRFPSTLLPHSVVEHHYPEICEGLTTMCLRYRVVSQAHVWLCRQIGLDKGGIGGFLEVGYRGVWCQTMVLGACDQFRWGISFPGYMKRVSHIPML